jgi:hypothetical protein
MEFLGGYNNKELSEEVSNKLKLPIPSLSECNKIFTSNKTKVVKRNQPLFYNDETRNVISFEDEECKKTKLLGVLLKVEFNKAPIIFDGDYCSVVTPVQCNDYLAQRCVLTNFVYYPNDDSQWVYVGKYNDASKKVILKTLDF